MYNFEKRYKIISITFIFKKVTKNMILEGSQTHIKFNEC